MGVKFIGGKYKKSCQKVSGNDIFWQLFYITVLCLLNL